MLRIRLSRVGRKNQPFFKIVVIPRSAPTTGGNFKAELGTHDPVNNETTIDHEEARSWIAKGAQPTDTVHNLFIKHGVITGRKVSVHDKEPVEPKEEEPKDEKKKKTTKKETKEDKKEEKKETKKETSKEDKKEEKEIKEKAKTKDKKEDTDKKEKTEKKKEENEEGSKKKKKEIDKKETKDKKEKEEADDQEKGGDLESLGLTTRITNALEDAEIDSVEKLKEKSEDELSEVKGLGKKSIEKIVDALK